MKTLKTLIVTAFIIIAYFIGRENNTINIEETLFQLEDSHLIDTSNWGDLEYETFEYMITHKLNNNY